MTLSCGILSLFLFQDAVGIHGLSVPGNPGAELLMSEIVKSQRMCVLYATGASGAQYQTMRVNFELELTYSNIGSHPLLLHQENSTTIGSLKIAASEEDLRAGKYEYSTNYDLLWCSPDTTLGLIGLFGSYAAMAINSHESSFRRL
jgi:hypothetical protein